MKKYIFILITPLVVFAQAYMAKIQPYDEFTIYAQDIAQEKENPHGKLQFTRESTMQQNAKSKHMRGKSRAH